LNAGAAGPLPGDGRHRIGVLISGRGSNLAAIVQARLAGKLPAPVSVVIANLPDAPGLDFARAQGIPTVVIDHREAASREQHDQRMTAALRQAGVTVVCLAGYLRLLSPAFIREFAGRILNIHPSLLPAFPGLHAQRQALAHGVRVTGCTVHLVDEGLDSGPILAQAAVPVEEGDDEERLAARILAAEHQIYPEALRLFCEDRIEIVGRIVRVVPETVRK